jgi:tetratricopeptide (TPR) repeat protein
LLKADSIHWRARTVLCVVLLLTLAATGLVWSKVTRAAREQVPRMYPGSPLADVLRWPWTNFPPVTRGEQTAIHEDLQTGEPLVEHSLPLLPWPQVPTLRPLRPAGDAFEGVECGFSALRHLLAVQRSAEASDAAPADTDQAAAVEEAVRCFPDPEHMSGGRWSVLYGRGLLYLARDNPAAAERDLSAALLELPAGTTGGDRAQATLHEARIYTYYALGQALSRGGQQEPPARHIERRLHAIENFRKAVQEFRLLWMMRLPAYPGPNSLTFAALQPTDLSTATLDNDLIAAYLSDPDYHFCPDDHPTRLPCDTLPRRPDGSPCDYRDRAFCLSMNRASGDLAPAFTDLLHRFYANDPQAWNEEYRLWALSDAVDRSAENPDLARAPYPYRFYNLGALLLQLGDFDGAASNLTAATNAIGGRTPDLPTQDEEHIRRLAVIANILADKPLSGVSRSRADKEKSALRKKYEELYPADLGVGDGSAAGGAPRIEEFPAVGDVFAPPAQALLDRWLFIHLWRSQLAAGDFQGFGRDYERLMSDSDQSIPRDFFRIWHDEVLGDVVARARARAEEFRKQGERDRADLIDRWLLDSGQVPPRLAGSASGTWSRFAHLLPGWIRKAGLALLTLATLLVCLLLLALDRVYSRTFKSAHRTARLADMARRSGP